MPTPAPGRGSPGPRLRPPPAQVLTARGAAAAARSAPTRRRRRRPAPLPRLAQRPSLRRSRCSPGASNKLVSPAFPPRPPARSAAANQRRRLCDERRPNLSSGPEEDEGAGAPTGTMRGRGGERKRTSTRFLKGQAAEEVWEQKNPSGAGGFSEGGKLYGWQMPLLHRVYGSSIFSFFKASVEETFFCVCALGLF